jgi:hypothetical protein
VLAERPARMRDGALVAILAAAVAFALVAVGSMDLSGLVERRDWDKPGSDAVWLLSAGLALLLGASGVVATETWVRLSTLARYVRPGVGPRRCLSRPALIRRALEELTQASAGIVVVYSVHEPFVGSGLPVDATSYPVPMLPAGDAGSERRPVRLNTATALDGVSLPGWTEVW